MKGPIKRFRGHLSTVLVASGVTFALFAWFLGIGGGLPSLGGGYRIQAVVPTAASLARGANVTMAGVDVGSVTSVRRQGLGAVIDIEIDDDRVTPLPEDSRVRVRLRTPAGENYVSIEPGRSSRTLPSGAVLPASQAGEYVDVDRILSVLQGPSRQRARELIQGMGNALDGRGRELNTLVAEGAGSLSSGSRVVRVVARQHAQVSRLVQELGDVAGAIGDRSEAVRTLARQGLASFRALAAQDETLRELLAELPSTLTRVRSATTTLSSVTDRATPVVASLAAAVRDLEPAVRSLRPAADSGRGVVRELGSAAPPLEQMLVRLRALAPPADRALPALHKTLCEVNPMIRYLKPYTPDVISTIVGLGSASNSYDAIGHVIRMVPIVSENALVGLPPEVSKAAHVLIHGGLLKEVNALNWNPYPKPGQVGRNDATGKTILGPDELAKSGFKYPRVTPDC